MMRLDILSMQIEQEQDTAALVAAASMVAHPEVLDPNLALQLQEQLQFSMNLGTISDDRLISEISSGISREFDEIQRDVDTSVAVESLCTYLSRKSKQGALGKEAITLANFAFEELRVKSGGKAPVMRISLESDGGTALDSELQRIALSNEGFKHSVSNKVIKITHMLSDLFSRFNSKVKDLKHRAADLNAAVHSKDFQSAKFPAIKAENWCINLCYTQSGFDVGLKNVLSDTIGLLKDHASTNKALLDELVGWMQDHRDQAGSDDVFESLSTDPKMFLVGKMQPFNRSIDYEASYGDNHFYRSAELPGGKAFYVQTSPTAKHGLDALECLEHTKYKLALYNPNSYHTTAMKIATIAALPVAVWMGVTAPLLGPIAAYGLGTLIEKVAHSHMAQKVHIEKEMLFQALTIEEIKHVVSEVNAVINALHTWSAHVLEGPWKSRKLDELVDEIMSDPDTVSNFKSYCNCILKLASSTAAGVERHCIDVLTSALQFAEKSLKQYE